jgi:serine phosphatase RsbU (regulator of sigma subunit)
MMNDDDLLFADESDELLFAEDDNEDSQPSDEDNKDTWKILIVDDEEQVHSVTRFALSDYQYKNKKLTFLDAFSGNDAIRILQENNDIALVLLDVVMESNDAGLLAVDRIRNELKNHFIRIILRTGQPGQAPEEEVIVKYDINDYKNKTELTDKKLFTSITTGLRSYADIMEIENYRQNLEQKVIERTAEVTQQKEIIEQINRDLTDSIRYASSIQESVLPEVPKIKTHLSDFFVFFSPRDIVSGDFYWFTHHNGKTVIAAVDCTGHGVPGAFMSMLANVLLNQIINIEGILEADEILNHLHQRVRLALKQAETHNRDGMDLALCVYDSRNKTLSFAGAKNPLIYIQNNEIFEIKGDRYPIGGEQKETERFYSRHSFSIENSTCVYLFSDGFPDQFGGPENKKFLGKRLRELFLEIHHLPFSEQHEKLRQTFEEWKGEGRKQMDDVLVIGFKID